MNFPKLPSRVRITRKATYELVYVDDFKDKCQMGECRPDPKQIVIKSNLSNTDTIMTFIHEVIHATSMENDFPLTEKQVEALEKGLYRVLRLNKWL